MFELLASQHKNHEIFMVVFQQIREVRSTAVTNRNSHKNAGKTGFACASFIHIH